MLEGALRVDIFALHEGTDIDAPIVAPLRPRLPALRPQQNYVFDIVLRTLTLGHLFTEGTADSNQVWLESNGQRRRTLTSARAAAWRLTALWIRGRTSSTPMCWTAMATASIGATPRDIFTPLYNHQIPPGAASTAHFSLRTPADLAAPLTLTVRLRYRKFDTNYLRLFTGDDSASNTLPVVTIATDRVTFSRSQGTDIAAPGAEGAAPPEIPAWGALERLRHRPSCASQSEAR